MQIKKVNVITGHYGSGKTNFAVNLALDAAKRGERVTVVDLDIVNPYFRTADCEQLFADNDIRLIVPTYANSNLDIPALNFDLASIVRQEGLVIVDVGGDDEGAKALGRYAHCLEGTDMQMLYVVNRFRYLTKEPEEALELMYLIEQASSLKCTGIVNNSNLGCDTDIDTVNTGILYGQAVAEKAGLPLVCVCVNRSLDVKADDNIYPIDIYVKKLWE